MKAIFSFLFGIVAALLLVFYLKWNYFRAPDPVSAPAPATSAAKEIFLTGTLYAPDALKTFVAPEKGSTLFTVSRNLFVWRDGKAEAGMNVAFASFTALSFPFRFKVPFDRARMGDSNGPLVLSIRHCPNQAKPEECLWGQTTPQLIAHSGVFELPSSADDVDLGAIHFTRVITQRQNDPCVSKGQALSGRIFPSAEFSAKAAKSKFALAVIKSPVMVPQAQIERPRPADSSALASALLHSQFLDFSKGPAVFSLPQTGDGSLGYGMLVYAVE